MVYRTLIIIEPPAFHLLQIHSFYYTVVAKLISKKRYKNNIFLDKKRFHNRLKY